MGGSSKQVIGYQYFSFFLLFIGNPIEKVLGINFDKRGWHAPLIDEMGNPLNVGVIEKATLYGENEGGVAGQIHARYGMDNQEVVSFYKDYMDSKELPASAYPYQSYLAFPDFYVGNSGYMKEMLLWPKRTRIRNDGSRQWYEVRGDGAVVCEIDKTYISSGSIKQSYVDYDGVIEIDKFTTVDNNVETKINLNIEIDKSDIFLHFDAPLGLQGSQSAVGTFRSSKVIVKRNSYIRGLMLVTVEYTYFGEDTTMNFIGNIINIVSDVTINYLGGRDRRTIVYVIDVTNSNIIAECQSTTAKLIPDTTTYSLEASVSISFKNYDRDWYSEGVSPDINPIHKIREILTDDTAMNKPESSVNNANFIKAADRIWDEGLGVSWSITDKSCIEAINELCYHIEAGIRVNRQTGLYEMVLFRDNWFEEDEIHTISESKIKSMQYEITNADEVINQVNVNFYDRANIKNSSFSISENGLIQTLNRVNAETVDFLYFMNMRNAEIVANWKLKQLSTGAIKGAFTTGWREARKWNRYDLIRLPWSKRWTGTILVRIMSINLGGPTNNEVSIEFIEVVPATGIMNTTIVADDVIDKPLPPQSCQYEPFELPYYLAAMALGQRKVDEELAYESNFGLVGTVAEKPQENSLYAVMMTNNYDEWVRAGSIQYSETADFDQIISKTSTSFTVNNWKKIVNVSTGTLIKCGRDWLGTPGEWMVFQGVDPYTGIISVKRGALDTMPQEWGPGSKLYFCGNDVAFDETEYVAGEEVLVSALTTTPSGVLEQGGSIPIEMKARAIRPYPPANVRINNEYWPKDFEGDLVVTWVNRNRLQQTGGSILGWMDATVSLEDGVVTTLVIEEMDDLNAVIATHTQDVTALNTYTLPLSSINTDSTKVKVSLKTARDGYESYQYFQHTTVVRFNPPYNFTAAFDLPNNEVDMNWSFD